MDHPDRAAGQVVAGRFRLVQKLGQGGMGSVWIAEHLTLKINVAVKFMDHAFAAGDSTALKRFNQEAMAAAAIQSPHIVKILDYGKDQAGRPYLAMELMKGEELEMRLEREGQLPIADVQKIVIETCKGLAAAHASNVIHRDLKPENIFLCKEHDGTIVKVLDFGIARTEELTGSGNLTITGQLLGTPMFMSPEQALGKKDIDARSDLYSFGVVIYKCLTGQTPYEEADTVGEIIVAITSKPMKPPSKARPSLQPGLVVWLETAMAKERSARFQTAKEMAEAFVDACAVRKMAISFSGLDVDDTMPPKEELLPRPSTPPPAVITEPGARAKKKGGGGAWFLFALVLLLLAGGAFVFFFRAKLL